MSDANVPLLDLLKDERFDDALVLVESGKLVHDGSKSALLMAIRHGSPSRLARAEKKNSVDARRLVDAFIAQEAPLYVDELATFLFLSWGPSDEDAAVSLVEELLRHYGAEGTFEGGSTLLHAAACAGLPKLVERLLRAGLDPTKATESGETPAQLAAAAHSPAHAAECLRLLLDHGKGTRLEGSSVVHAILNAARHNHRLEEMNAELAARIIGLCRIALDHGEDLRTKDRFGQMPLDALLTSLDKAGPTFDEASYPTYMATSDAQIFARDVALFLIDRGGATPETLPLAARAHLALLLEELLKRDAPAPDATYGKSKGTLLHAVLGRDEFSGEMTARSIRCLLRYGVSPEQRDAKKKTAWDVYTKVKRTLRPAWRKVIEDAYEGALAEMAPGSAAKPNDARTKSGARRKAGVRFPCASMHLAVLGALWAQKLIKLPLKKLLADIEVDEDSDDPDEALREAVTRLHDVPIEPAAAAKLTHLDFSGGNAIYLELEEIVDAHTGGETDAYQLGSLEGIDKLTALRSLSLSGFGYNPGGVDLKPLAEHPSLSEITLSGKCANGEALASIANLSKIDFDGAVSLGEEVIARLKAKGVAIGPSSA